MDLPANCCGDAEWTPSGKMLVCRQATADGPEVRVNPVLCADCRKGKTPGSGTRDPFALGGAPPFAASPGLVVCSHRGAETGELRECPTCGNRRVKLKVFTCTQKRGGITHLDCRTCPRGAAAPA